MGRAAALVLVGEGVGEKIAHLHGIWICALANRETHDAHAGQGLPQVVVHSPCAGALLCARTGKACPGQKGAPFDLLARRCMRRGIEADERLFVSVPVQVEGIQMPLEAF